MDSPKTRCALATSRLGISQVACTAFLHDHFRAWERLRQSPTPPAWSRWMWVTTMLAGLRARYRAAVAARPRPVPIVHAGFDEARARGANEVGRGDRLVAAHARVHHEDLVAEVGGVGVHVAILHRIPGRWLRAKVRLRGPGQFRQGLRPPGLDGRTGPRRRTRGR